MIPLASTAQIDPRSGNRQYSSDRLRVVLCDADGNLFPSEEPAFVASAEVTNEFLRSLGVDRTYSAEELRTATTGLNFRSTAVALAITHGVSISPELDVTGRQISRAGRATDSMLTTEALQEWVEKEKRAVTAYLSTVLQPDDDVLTPLTTLATTFELAVVTSSAASRIAACLAVTGLASFFPPARQFSAEDSLPRPVSKPDPAIYVHAGRRLALDVAEAVAVEDSVPGISSAVAAGFAAIGNLQFVPRNERDVRRAALYEAGADYVVDSWEGVVQLLMPP